MYNNDNNQGFNSEMFGEDGKNYNNNNQEFTHGNGMNGLNYSMQDNNETLNSYATKTFLWMFGGLMATFITAIMMYASGIWAAIFSVPYLAVILLIAEMLVVITLSARINKLKSTTAVVLFFVYAILNGVVFSTFFVMYDLVFLIFVFGITALFFGGLACYGFVTKKDLTKLGPILIGGLIFMMIFYVFALFINLEAFDIVISFIGLALFMGLTAYDTQKIKMYYNAYGTDSEMAKKTSIICALQLYLDFINIFIYLLRILGRKR